VLSPIPSIFGTVVAAPSQVPARLFILSNDFCAFDWVGAAASAAKAVAAIKTNTTEIAMRDFISVSFSLFLRVPESLSGESPIAFPNA
jgi:hypothetical protein